MTINPPIALGASKEQVMAYAERIAAKLGIAPDTDLEGIVKRLDGKLVPDPSADFLKKEAGSLVVLNKDDFTIFYSPLASAERTRFTIAHELGHFFLHYINQRKGEGHMQAAREGSDRCEWEANWFAGAFLMPATQFKKQYNRYAGNIPTVAAIFNVSIAAAEVRAKVLGLTS